MEAERKNANEDLSGGFLNFAYALSEPTAWRMQICKAGTLHAFLIRGNFLATVRVLLKSGSPCEFTTCQLPSGGGGKREFQAPLWPN